MREKEIREWIKQLTTSLGDPRPLADAVELEVLHHIDDFTGMLGAICKKLQLNMQLRVGLVNSGGVILANGLPAPAWVDHHGDPPPYGTRAFASHRVTVYIRRQFIAEVPFGTLVLGMAHELSHVVLDAVGHPLQDVEEAVDLTAMLLGFRQFYLKYAQQVSVTTIGKGWIPERTRVNVNMYGYLSLEEIRYAARLMQT